VSLKQSKQIQLLEAMLKEKTRYYRYATAAPSSLTPYGSKFTSKQVEDDLTKIAECLNIAAVSASRLRHGLGIQ